MEIVCKRGFRNLRVKKISNYNRRR